MRFIDRHLRSLPLVALYRCDEWMTASSEPGLSRSARKAGITSNKNLPKRLAGFPRTRDDQGAPQRYRVYGWFASSARRPSKRPQARVLLSPPPRVMPSTPWRTNRIGPGRSISPFCSNELRLSCVGTKTAANQKDGGPSILIGARISAKLYPVNSKHLISISFQGTICRFEKSSTIKPRSHSVFHTT